jgi:hypothetical protein
MPALQSVVELIAIARRYPARALSPEHHQSYPIPVLTRAGLWVGFLYGKGIIVEPGEGLLLQAPTYLAWIDGETGALEEMKAVTAAALGLHQPEGEFLGRYLTLPERMAPEFLTWQLRLYQLYDALLPAFAAGQAEAAPEIAGAAGDFKRLFAKVTEAPLLPYYRAVGSAFFAWLNTVDR